MFYIFRASVQAGPWLPREGYAGQSQQREAQDVPGQKSQAVLFQVCVSDPH